MATGGRGFGSDLEALVLAAGAGSRFGGDKLRATYRGRRLIDWAVEAALAAPVRRVTVVVGADPNLIRHGPPYAGHPAQGLADAKHGGRPQFSSTAIDMELGSPGKPGQDGLRVVHAPDHTLGLAHSLRAGIDSLPADTRGVFVFLGDMPRIPHAILAPMAAALTDGAEAAAPLHPRGRGHPVLLGGSLFGEVAALRGDRGARSILDGLGARLALISTEDDGVLTDIDRPQDLA